MSHNITSEVKHVHSHKRTASLSIRFEAGDLFILFSLLHLASAEEVYSIFMSGPKIAIREGWLYLDCPQKGSFAYGEGDVRRTSAVDGSKALIMTIFTIFWTAVKVCQLSLHMHPSLKNLNQYGCQRRNPFGMRAPWDGSAVLSLRGILTYLPGIDNLY